MKKYSPIKKRQILYSINTKVKSGHVRNRLYYNQREPPKHSSFLHEFKAGKKITAIISDNIFLMKMGPHLIKFRKTIQSRKSQLFLFSLRFVSIDVNIALEASILMQVSLNFFFRQKNPKPSHQPFHY